jgi:mono/diheme cytochrome c family protein
MALSLEGFKIGRDRLAILALAACFLWTASSYAIDTVSEHVADAHHGLALAKNWCASCHVISAGQPLPRKNAPAFATIAQSESFSADRLAYLLYDPHPTMAKLALSRPAIEDLAAYIVSLKER